MNRGRDAPEPRLVPLSGFPQVAVRRWEGTGPGPGLLLVHGFLGDSLSWTRPVRTLAWPGPVVAVDLPGHGAGPGWHDGEPRRRYRVPDVARMLGGLQDQLFSSPPVWLGYSMGGRIAISAAVQGVPMAALLLESASPGIADAGLRAERRRMDEQRAADLVRRGTRAFVASWMELPLFQGLGSLPADVRDEAVEIRAGQDAGAMAAWLREGGAGAQPWYGEELRRVGIPVRILVGARDEKYRALWTDLAPALPDARLTQVEGVGHMPHLEAVEAWAAWVADARPGTPGG